LLYLPKYLYDIFSVMYWSNLPNDWLKELVKLFQKESAELIGQISCGKTKHDFTRRLQNSLEVLRILYKVPFLNI